MYINIGNDVAIPSKLIVGIFDLDQCTGAKDQGSKQALQVAEKLEYLHWIEGDLPRSIVVCINEIYISPINSETLCSRLTAQRDFS